MDKRFAGRPLRDDPRLYAKAAVIAAWFFGSYLLLLTSRSGPVQLLLCVSLALAACGLGFNVFHDSIHESFSDDPRVNLALAAASSAVLGASRKLWWFKHNVLHHRFTNIHGWDDDLETRGSLRLSPDQAWLPKFRLQHWYFPFLYALTTLEWMFVKDFVQYATGRINPYQELPKLSFPEKAEFWAAKAFYMTAFVAVPIAVFGPGRALLGLLLCHVTLSWSLAFVFNLAHASEGAAFPEATGLPLTVEDEWAAHQLRTTVNFAAGNGWLSWFAGGLNHQIEHHLFPRVSHTHYPELGKIVKETALELGLPYLDHATYAGALSSHWRLLRALSRP